MVAGRLVAPKDTGTTIPKTHENVTLHVRRKFPLENNITDFKVE